MLVVDCVVHVHILVTVNLRCTFAVEQRSTVSVVLQKVLSFYGNKGHKIMCMYEHTLTGFQVQENLQEKTKLEAF